MEYDEHEPPVPTPDDLHREAINMQGRLDTDSLAEVLYQASRAEADRERLSLETHLYGMVDSVYGPRVLLSILRRLDALEAR